MVGESALVNAPATLNVAFANAKALPRNRSHVTLKLAVLTLIGQVGVLAG